MKKTTGVTVKLTDDERASIETAARAQNVSVSEYVRRSVAVAPKGETAVQPATGMKSYHVDDLGPDTLRADNGALTR